MRPISTICPRYEAKIRKGGGGGFFWKWIRWKRSKINKTWKTDTADEEYGPEYDENILFFEFSYDLLDDAQFEIPLVFVNREAPRGIALGEQGIELRSRENRQYPIFVRPFEWCAIRCAW